MEVLLSLNAPTGPMRQEAAAAGFYDSPWGSHPRLQIITVGDLLDGRRIDTPALRQLDVTLERAPRERARGAGKIGGLTRHRLGRSIDKQQSAPHHSPAPSVKG